MFKRIVCAILLLVRPVFDLARHLTSLGCRPSAALFQSTYFLREHASKVRRPPVLL